MKLIIVSICLLVFVSVVSTQTCPAPTYNIAPLSGFHNGTGVNLTGINVFLTGGSRGIGRATSLFLAGLGANVFSCARTLPWRLTNRQEIINAGIRYDYCDVTIPATLRIISNRFEKNNVTIDWLLNIAGIMFFGTPNDIAPFQHSLLLQTNTQGFTALWSSMMDVMTRDPITFLVDDVIQTRNSTISIITSSTADFLSPFLAHYSGSKIDLDRNTQSVAWTNLREPHRFNIILPALTNTTILENSLLPYTSKCMDKVMSNYESTKNLMLTTGQPTSVVYEALLYNFINAASGDIIRASASTSSAYAQYVFLSQINARNQPDTAIKTYQPLFAPSNADPIC